MAEQGSQQEFKGIALTAVSSKPLRGSIQALTSMDTTQPTEPSLTTDEIRSGVGERLARYENLNLLEQYAMFMGTAQILEYSLKGLLHCKYAVDRESMERWTLGRTKEALQKQGLRGDFIALLNSVIGYRNHIAHEFLANEIALRSLLGGDAGRLEVRQLHKGIYELEQLMFLHNWCEAHDAWD